MFLRTCVFLAALALPSLAMAQPAHQVIHLWEKGAPGFESLKDEPELAKDYWVKNINNPSVTVFPAPPEKANGCAVLVVPGGGFRELVFEREGAEAAEFLNTLGVTAFVLKYRLYKAPQSPYSIDNVRQDGYRAMRLIRSHAASFHVDPNRIGVLGFSAGGRLVNLIAYDKADGDPKAPDAVDRANGRPSFLMMVYPGEPAPDTVPSDTPPAFLLAATDDDYGCDAIALSLYEKFRAAKVPVEAHFIVRGRHGFNMGDRSPYAAINHWPQRMADWMGDSGFLAPAGPAK